MILGRIVYSNNTFIMDVPRPHGNPCASKNVYWTYPSSIIFNFNFESRDEQENFTTITYNEALNIFKSHLAKQSIDIIEKERAKLFALKNAGMEIHPMLQRIISKPQKDDHED